MGRKLGSRNKVQTGTWLECQSCGNQFYAQKSAIESGIAKYCSRRCMYDGRNPPERTGTVKKCEVCATDFYVSPGRSETARFCSYECTGKGTYEANAEVLRNRATTHGKSKTVEFRRWMRMRQRCRDDAHYVRRGIKVCKRWDESFEAFLEDMGPIPTPQHTVDRYPDNDGNYEPGNCRWATKAEQGWSKVGVPHTPAHRAKQGTRGELNSKAKVTEADVRAIRASEGIESRHEVAERYGITYGIVYDIQKRRTWAWLD